jgi:ketosteroid isomerase-like protein
MLCVGLSLAISSCKLSSKVITEEDIKWMMRDVEDANKKKDVNRVINHMAPDIVINLTMKSAFGMQNIRFTRDEYKAHIEEGWAKATLYEYHVTNKKLTISEDGRSAFTESDVTEVLEVQGKRAESSSHQKTFLEIVDGKILVTRLDATLDVETPDFFDFQ